MIDAAPSTDGMLRHATLTPADGTALYAQLRTDVMGAGLLDRDYRYYAILTSAIVLGVAVSLFYVIRLPVSAPLVFWALLFTFLAVQICGIIHDAGHRAIFRSRRLNDVLGTTCAALLAMGFSSWREQHNAHHAQTNAEDGDPDLDIPLHAFTLRQFQKQGGIWRYARRYQVFFFYPIRTLVVYSRRLGDIAYFWRQPFSVRLVSEIVLWIAGITVWFMVPFLAFPLAKALVLFAIVHASMGFYLSNIFAPNHKGMPQIAKGTEISFLEQQIVTSRNVAPNWITDVLYIGLNYQIEHHLFPNCPRSRLKHITPYVVAVCRQMKVEYTQVGILESNRIILQALNTIAKTDAH